MPDVATSLALVVDDVDEPEPGASEAVVGFEE
jgi:hypothetical protein